MHTIKTFITTHKKTSIVLALGIAAIAFFAIRAATKAPVETRYVTATASKGTIVQSVSATGQITTSETLDLKPQTSGTVVSIRAKAGQQVTKGQLLFTIDPSDAQKALRNAQNSLSQAKLDLASAQASATSNQSDLQKAVTNAYATLLSGGLEAVPSDFMTTGFTPPTVSGNYTLGKEGTFTITTYGSQGGTSFEAAGMGINVYGYASSVNPQPIAGTGLFLTFPNNTNAGLTWTIDIPNKNAPSYISNKNAYDNAVENLNQSESAVSSSAVTLQSKTLAVTQAEEAVADANDALADCYVRAPFDGVLASVDAIVGDSASSAAALGTVITNQKVAEVVLNEVDVAKVAVGDKATLTFDALSDLSITGTVAEVDTIGTVSSGVVNYTVKIALDSDTDAVKSGMSVTANIITGSATDVVTVPSSAIKTDSDGAYVETFASALAQAADGQTGSSSSVLPTRVNVTVGLSDDTNTEVSGISDGAIVVVRTVTASATKTQTQSAPSLIGGGGARASGASANRTFMAR
jgi:multidrug efflux pump subunit AcrA (membrane-fusion protein)